MTPLVILKKFFEQADQFAPQGGRKLERAEIMALTSEERLELAKLAAVQLGVEVVVPA